MTILPSYDCFISIQKKIASNAEIDHAYLESGVKGDYPFPYGFSDELTVRFGHELLHFSVITREEMDGEYVPDFLHFLALNREREGTYLLNWGTSAYVYVFLPSNDDLRLILFDLENVDEEKLFTTFLQDLSGELFVCSLGPIVKFLSETARYQPDGAMQHISNLIGDKEHVQYVTEIETEKRKENARYTVNDKSAQRREERRTVMLIAALALCIVIGVMAYFSLQSQSLAMASELQDIGSAAAELDKMMQRDEFKVPDIIGVCDQIASVMKKETDYMTDMQLSGKNFAVSFISTDLLNLLDRIKKLDSIVSLSVSGTVENVVLGTKVYQKAKIIIEAGAKSK